MAREILSTHIFRRPSRLKKGSLDALVCRIDSLYSMASRKDRSLTAEDAPVNVDILDALPGNSPFVRDHLVEHAFPLSLIDEKWKPVTATWASIHFFM
jgi:hypothetical protein